ncbi:MAG: hypothetical protein EOP34_10425 [Rickettsiales bacterium]|nr:MAG: hypothetical protein EOP34_10425 [Rickettsiales bacterium]
MSSDQNTRNSREARRAGFLRYLAILVDWVNANPQVLNEEERDPSTYVSIGDYPEPNKSYKIYQYIAPKAKKDQVNVRNLLNAIFNLKVSLLNGTAGFNGTRIGSDVFGMPNNIVSPFSQYAYSSALPTTNVTLIGKMAGGDVTKSMSELVRPYSSEILEDIFNTLLNTMDNISSPRRLALKDHSREQMKDRINNLKKLECDLMEQFRKAGLKYQLYKASDGYIMPGNIRDSDLDTVLKKHENLLDLSHVYNRKATTVLDMFKIILEVIVDKSDNNAGKVKYTRPMNATY